MTDKTTSLSLECLKALEILQREFDEKKKKIQFDVYFRYAFECKSTSSLCKLEIFTSWGGLQRELTKENFSTQMQTLRSATIERLDGLVEIYELAAARGLEIKLSFESMYTLECHPPIHREKWRIDVGDYSNTHVSVDPRIYLVETAAKEAPQLAK